MAQLRLTHPESPGLHVDFEPYRDGLHMLAWYGAGSEWDNFYYAFSRNDVLKLKAFLEAFLRDETTEEWDGDYGE